MLVTVCPRPGARLRTLLGILFVLSYLALGSLAAQEPLEIYSVKQADGTPSDGYAIDQTGDKSGDVKLTAKGNPYLTIAETSDTQESRAWIPFLLTEDQKALVLQSGMSVTLRLYLSATTHTTGLRLDIHGSGYRSAYRVNQTDFETLRKKLVPNAFNENSVTGHVYEFDVTAFVREEAARLNAPGIAFGFVIQVHDESLIPVADGILQQFKLGSSTSANTSQSPSLLIAARQPVTNPIDPAPIDPRAVKILILGNSILKNGPMLDKGWAGNWGMGASAASRDFAHVLMTRIQASIGRPVIFMLHNIAAWERSWSTVRSDDPMITYARDFEPDIILSCISENTGLVDTSIPGYTARYADMISIISGGATGQHRADVVVRGSFWGINANTDLALSQVAAAHGWPYVKCSDLGVNTQYQAVTATYYIGPPPVDAGVLAHPNDLGMQAISDRIWDGGLSALLTNEYVLPPATSAYYNWSVLFGGEKRASRIGPTADFDGDGRPNLLEYAQNSDPLAATPGATETVGPSAVIEMDAKSSLASLGLRFQIRSNDLALHCQIGWSSDMTNWTWTELAFEGGRWVSRDSSALSLVDQQQAQANLWAVTVRDVLVPVGARRFGTMRISTPN